MFCLTMGNAPRSVRRPQMRPMQRVHLFSLSQSMSVVAEGRTEVTITLPPSEKYAGVYRISLADLAQGPICLVAATVTLSEDTAVASAALWAYASDSGMPQGRSSWQVDGQTITGADEPVLLTSPDLAGRTLHYIETIQQGMQSSVSVSAPVEVPEQSMEPEPAEPEPVEYEPMEPEPVEPELDRFGVVYRPDGTVQVGVDKTNPVTFTIESPHIHAGTHTLTPAMLADMAQGPTCLVMPEIALDGAGENLVVTRIGLWAYDADLGEMAITRRWHKNGVAIPEQVSQTLAIADHRGLSLQHIECAVQPGLERLAASSAVTLPELGGVDLFEGVADNTNLAGGIFESGIAWAAAYNGAKIFQSNVRANASNTTNFIARLDEVSADHYAEGEFAPRISGGSDAGTAFAVRVTDRNNGYGFFHNGSTWRINMRKLGVVSQVNLQTGITYAPGTVLFVRGEAQDVAGGVRLRLYVNGNLIGEHTDTAVDRLLTGRGGVMVRGAASGSSSDAQVISFNAGDL